MPGDTPHCPHPSPSDQKLGPSSNSNGGSLLIKLPKQEVSLRGEQNARQREIVTAREAGESKGGEWFDAGSVDTWVLDRDDSECV